MRYVAPLVGAWIEIAKKNVSGQGLSVAPLVEAWIEILICIRPLHPPFVAPLVGAWIVFLIGQVGLFLMLLINIL